MAEKLEETVRRLVIPLIEAQELELWGIAVTPGPVVKVAIYVDRPVSPDTPDQESATIDQCETISRQLGLALEIEDCINQPWVLEVSTPGLERRFFSLKQLEAYKDDIIDVKLKESENKRKNWRGRLLAVDTDSFTIQPCSISEDGVITPDNISPQKIVWNNVRNAHRIFVFTAPRKPGRPNQKKPGKK